MKSDQIDPYLGALEGEFTQTDLGRFQKDAQKWKTVECSGQAIMLRKICKIRQLTRLEMHSKTPTCLPPKIKNSFGSLYQSLSAILGEACVRERIGKL